jgi:hypothetical protein
MRVVAAAVSVACLLGCGSADETRTVKPDDEAHTLEFTPTLNLCPHFEGSFILPQTIAPGAVALLGVRAVDPDGDDLAISYGWSALSGAFTKPDRPVTEYSCDALGDQPLNVTATDSANCDATLQVSVTCLSE